MTRPKGEPANDNIAVANDNLKLNQRMSRYMRFRRRHPGKTRMQLLRDGLDIVVARAPHNDPEAQAFIAAVRDLLAAEPPADHAQDHAS